MKKSISRDYEEAIKGKYNEEKTGDYAEYLVNPTPKLLKRLAVLRYDAASAIDKETLNRFFSFTGNDIHRQIEKFDGDKLKPLCKFLKGETSTFKNPSSLELIAVLVDFHPRPLNKFMRNDVQQIASADELKNKEKEEEYTKEEIIGPDNKKLVRKKKNNSLIHKIAFFILLLFCGGYIINDIVTKECMVWNNDHYEAVDCDKRTNNFFSSQKIIPLDKETLEHQKKIVVTDTTQFFLENGIPCIWYAKRGGEIEYFTYPGLHPETGETLKKITPYMINKYVVNNYLDNK